MGRDWKRLGDAFRAAREERNLTQAELAAATDQNQSTIQNLESGRYGKGFTRIPQSAHVLAAYYGWAEGSLQSVLAGGDPVEHELDEATDDAPSGGREFRDPRMQAIWDLKLPQEEREQGIRDLMEADLRRAREREEKEGGATESARRTG